MALLEQKLSETLRTVDWLEHNSDLLVGAGNLLLQVFQDGGKVIFCGNGGSAADSQHLAAEFVGRYKKDRPALAAIALTTDTSALTAIGNDFGFEKIFVRQLEALAKPADLVLHITTSGNSDNILQAIEYCRKNNIKQILLTGKDGGFCKNRCDLDIIVPSDRTDSIQETHIFIGHYLCEYIEELI